MITSAYNLVKNDIIVIFNNYAIAFTSYKIQFGKWESEANNFCEV